MKSIFKYFIIFILLSSCQIKKIETSNITKIVEEKKEIILDKVKKKKNKKEISNNNVIKYHIGEPYFIEGVKYIPKEEYNYDKDGLASFYGKELHNVKTINNDLNKVTELLGRHKTLPLPSTVKITNLENGISLIIKINDRHEDNLSEIQVSRKVAQLLKFYKNKIARVNIKIMSEPSKQMKIVTSSMNDPNFSKTVSSAPTEIVTITDLNENVDNTLNNVTNPEIPIEITQEEVSDKELFLKIYNFKSYDDAKKIINKLDIKFNNTIENEGSSYSILLGPLENDNVNNLVSSFISSGYKQTEIIIE
tara:strand:+ start:263 stop:1183 length:921 start_codon:yes stop_codon:yes gene_type:complete